MIVWKQLLVVIHKMCGIASIDRIKENMLDRAMRLTPVSVDAIVVPPVEERGLLWTTYDNLHTWFMSFKEFCFKFKFATPNCNGDAVFLPETLRRVANVDETDFSLDGIDTQAGGRPAMSYRDPHLPMIMRLVAKSSLKCTCIFGSTATGEPIPVHHQLPTSATLAEREKLQYDFCRHLKSWAVWS